MFGPRLIGALAIHFKSSSNRHDECRLAQTFWARRHSDGGMFECDSGVRGTRAAADLPRAPTPHRR